METALIPQKPLLLRNRRNVFIGLFGVSLVAFASGFDSCLFDTETVGECVSHAQSWIRPFQTVGDHIIEWVLALINAAFSG